MRTLKKYSLEILYVFLVAVTAYLLPLAVRMHASSIDDVIVCSMVVTPMLAALHVVWYTIARHGRYTFAIVAAVLTCLGQGILFYRPNYPANDLFSSLMLGEFFALITGGAAAITSTITAFINACRRWSADRKKRLTKENPMNEIQRITSFTVDHDKLTPGIYISRVDGDVTTYDLRTRKPNGGEYMDTRTAHSVEHMFATLVRNSRIADRVLYFGPMGCRTGFYLLVREADNREVLAVVKDVLAKILAHEGEVFGAARVECGNYLDLDLADAKRECAAYLDVLNTKEEWSFSYE